MIRLPYCICGLVLIMGVWGCQQNAPQDINSMTPPSASFEQEKAAILTTLHGETRAAFSRDYKGWKGHWVHKPYVSKTYINFADSSMTETLGWEEIDAFVRTYIEQHPVPASLPTLIAEIDVRLYGNAAWVSYEQQDPERGLKRETRLMEKIEGKWKIAGMHTSIYGFQ